MSEEAKPPMKLADSLIRLAVVLTITGGLTFGLLYGAADSNMPSTTGPLDTASILWIVAAIAYGINWLVFIPANAGQTEKYYDLTGSITYLSCTIGSLLMGAAPKCINSNSGLEVCTEWRFTGRACVQSVFVILWCVRLGSFLFARIKRDNKDGRFDDIKTNPPRFFGAWTLQGLWVLLTALPVFTVNAVNSPEDLGVQDFIGWFVWAVGFGIEIVADQQKSNFAADASKKGTFINEGLWYYSRHPNYFGEITLWFGQFLAASSVFQNAQWTCIVSPLFVIFLLMKVSGVPMLEKRSDEKFKGNSDYELYKKNTSVLVIWFKGTNTERDGGLLQKEGNGNAV